MNVRLKTPVKKQFFLQKNKPVIQYTSLMYGMKDRTTGFKKENFLRSGATLGGRRKKKHSGVRVG